MNATKIILLGLVLSLSFTSCKKDKDTIQENTDIEITATTYFESTSRVNLFKRIAFYNGKLYITNRYESDILESNLSDSVPSLRVFRSCGGDPTEGIVEYNSYFYFIRGDKLSRTSTSSFSTSIQDIATGLNQPRDLLLVGNYLYIAEDISTNARILGIDLASSSSTISVIKSGLRSIGGLAFKDNYIYFTEKNGSVGLYNEGRVRRFSTSSPYSTETVAENLRQPNALAFKDNDLYICEEFSISKKNILEPSRDATRIYTLQAFGEDIAFHDGALYVSEGAYVTKLTW